MAIRAIIGKVDRQGNGQAVHLRHDGTADAAGATLLDHYSDAEPIYRLIGSGAIARRAPTPGNSTTYFRHYNQPWERCRPCAFRGGTDRFFANYWSPGPEWLYVWTPDGWLGSKAMPGAPPDYYYADSRTLRNAHPQWREWLRRTREFQRPLHSLIRAYRAQQPGPGEGSS